MESVDHLTDTTKPTDLDRYPCHGGALHTRLGSPDDDAVNPP
jgi:hypothetical protein